MFYSLAVHQANPNAASTKLDEQTYTNVAFYFTLAIVALDFIYPLVMIIFHKCISEKRYRTIDMPLYKAHENRYNLMPGTA